MKNTSRSVRFFYGTIAGRFLLKIFMKLRLDLIAVRFLCSSWSKPLAEWYIKHNNITVTREEKNGFRSFGELFTRTRESVRIDMTPDHLISPCDGWLSGFRINPDSCFSIKNSFYRVRDFLQDEALAQTYQNGICLIFRLCASDYHHYCYIDDGFQGKNHYIPGMLHSVQPIACEKYPVYTLNRRSWCLLETEHFGPVIQCEIGALIVGGIVNEKENERFYKGHVKGHFELAGSTIVLLFKDGSIKIRPELHEKLSDGSEIRVTQGEWIGTAGKNV